MILSKKYIEKHKDEINNTIYCLCLKDQVFKKSETTSFRCYKSLIYKFTKDKKIVFEYRVIDLDKSYKYIPVYIDLTDEQFSNFKLIGNLADIITYLENDDMEDL